MLKVIINYGFRVGDPKDFLTYLYHNDKTWTQDDFSFEELEEVCKKDVAIMNHDYGTYWKDGFGGPDLFIYIADVDEFGRNEKLEHRYYQYQWRYCGYYMSGDAEKSVDCLFNNFEIVDKVIELYKDYILNKLK